MRLRTRAAVLGALSVALLLGRLVLVGTTSHAAPAQPRIHSFRLSSPLYAPPALYGTTVAWTSQPTRCHHMSAPSICTTPVYLYLADTRHFHPRSIAHLPQGTAYVDLQLSRHFLVWQTRPYGASSPGWQVWVRDLSTGRQRLVASSSTEGGFMVPSYPALSLRGTTLEWIEHHCRNHCTKNGPSTVSLMNLTTGHHTELAREDAPCSTLGDPTLTDRTVVWTRTGLDIPGCPTNRTVHVVTLNRATGTVVRRTVTPRPGTIAFGFTANKHDLAWTQETLHTNRDSRVMLMNLGTGKVRVVTSRGADTPLLSDHLLVWYGGYRGSIDALDLRTWRYIRLASDSGGENTVFAATSLSRPAGTRVAWEESMTPATVVRFTYRLAVADLP